MDDIGDKVRTFFCLGQSSGANGLLRAEAAAAAIIGKVDSSFKPSRAL
jgi:hypothetical protein